MVSGHTGGSGPPEKMGKWSLYSQTVLQPAQSTARVTGLVPGEGTPWWVQAWDTAAHPRGLRQVPSPCGPSVSQWPRL